MIQPDQLFVRHTARHHDRLGRVAAGGGADASSAATDSDGDAATNSGGGSSSGFTNWTVSQVGHTLKYW